MILKYRSGPFVSENPIKLTSIDPRITPKIRAKTYFGCQLRSFVHPGTRYKATHINTTPMLIAATGGNAGAIPNPNSTRPNKMADHIRPQTIITTGGQGFLRLMEADDLFFPCRKDK